MAAKPPPRGASRARDSKVIFLDAFQPNNIKIFADSLFEALQERETPGAFRIGADMGPRFSAVFVSAMFISDAIPHQSVAAMVTRRGLLERTARLAVKARRATEDAPLSIDDVTSINEFTAAIFKHLVNPNGAIKLMAERLAKLERGDQEYRQGVRDVADQLKEFAEVLKTTKDEGERAKYLKSMMELIGEKLPGGVAAVDAKDLEEMLAKFDLCESEDGKGENAAPALECARLLDELDESKGRTAALLEKIKVLESENLQLKLFVDDSASVAFKFAGVCADKQRAEAQVEETTAKLNQSRIETDILTSENTRLREKVASLESDLRNAGAFSGDQKKRRREHAHAAPAAPAAPAAADGDNTD